MQTVRVILPISRGLGPGSFWGASSLRALGLGQTRDDGISFSWGLPRLSPQKHVADPVCCLQRRDEHTHSLPTTSRGPAVAPGRNPGCSARLSRPFAFLSCLASSHREGGSLFPVPLHLLACAQAGSSARQCPFPCMLSSPRS